MANPGRAPDTTTTARRDTLLAALTQVVPVPAAHRRWIDRAGALSTLRCTDDDLGALVEGGLASEDGRVEAHDTWNTGLYEGSDRTVPVREMTVMRHLLESRGGDWVSPRRYAVTASVSCPLPGACPPAAEWAAPALPAVTWSGHHTGRGTAVWEGETTLRGRAAPVLNATVLDVWHTVLTSYRYHLIPPSLARQVAATRARGVGECEALGRVLAEDLAAAGVPVRLRTGHLLGGTRTRRHYWVEFTDVDGAVKALDPSMAVLADSFFSEQYREFCCGSTSNRVLALAGEEDFEIEHDGPHGPVTVPVEVRLRLLPGPQPTAPDGRP